MQMSLYLLWWASLSSTVSTRTRSLLWTNSKISLGREQWEIWSNQMKTFHTWKCFLQQLDKMFYLLHTPSQRTWVTIYTLTSSHPLWKRSSYTKELRWVKKSNWSMLRTELITSVKNLRLLLSSPVSAWGRNLYLMPVKLLLTGCKHWKYPMRMNSKKWRNFTSISLDVLSSKIMKNR